MEIMTLLFVSIQIQNREKSTVRKVASAIRQKSPLLCTLSRTSKDPAIILLFFSIYILLLFILPQFDKSSK